MNMVVRGYNHPQTIVTRGLGWMHPPVQIIAPVPQMWEPEFTWRPWPSDERILDEEKLDALLELLKDDDEGLVIL
jgi:hypothetical protein